MALPNVSGDCNLARRPADRKSIDVRTSVCREHQACGQYNREPDSRILRAPRFRSARVLRSA